MRRERFDQNDVRQTGTDAEPGIANLANHVGFTAKQPDLLFLAESQFAQAMTDLGGGRKSFDADRGTRADLAQGTQFSLPAPGGATWG